MNSDTLIKCMRGIRITEFFEAGKKVNAVLFQCGYGSESALTKSGIAYCLGMRAGVRKERQKRKMTIDDHK